MDGMTKDEKLITEAKELFKEFEEYYSDERDRMREDQRFASGEQWPKAVKDMREKDPDGPRPCLTMDRTNQYRRQVVNDARQNKPAIKVRPADSGADIEVAELLQGVARHIEDQSNADVAYDTALDSAVVSGLGWFRILTKMVDVETNQQDITIARVPNLLSVYPDCDWIEPDGSDIKRLFVIDDMPKRKFELLYPKADLKGWDADDWIKKDTVRIAEYYKVSDSSTNLLMLSDGEQMTEDAYWTVYSGSIDRPQVIGTMEKKHSIVEWFKMTGGTVIDQTTVPTQWIPVIPVIGNESWVDGQRSLTGMIHMVKDAQRAYNYARSAEIEQVALAPKSPYIAADGQIEPYASEWKNANRRNQAVLRYSPMDINGHPVPPPQRQMAPGVSQGWMQEMQLAERDIQSALGMYSASIGAEGQEKSGRAIMARQREGDTSTFHYIDNLSRSIRHAGRIIIDMIPKVYDTKRIVRIVGTDDSVSQATLDPMLPRPMAQIKTGSGIKKIFNPTIGTYDVTVTVGPSYTTKRQEAADAMVELTRANPQIMPLVGDLMIKAMDWPMADEIAKRMKAMLPPEIKQLEESEEGENAEIQSAVQQVTQQYEQQTAQAMQAIQMLQAQLAEAQSALEEQQRQAEQKQADLLIKAKETEIKEFEAQTERIQVIGQLNQPVPVPAEREEPQENAQFAQLQQMIVELAQRIQMAQQPPMPVVMPEEEPKQPRVVRKEISIQAPSGEIYQGFVTESEE